MESKEQKYKKVLNDIKILTADEDDMISVMSTVSCEVFHAFDEFSWVGFYRRTGERTLKVGPYQGGHGCLVIDFDRGVCGRCAEQKTVQIENDVTKLSYHIACSSETRAEIVIPVLKNGELIAVLDIDSTEPDMFDEIDERYLTEIASLI
ncbi:MAG: GAF domain-containing protein [Candidatus Delongbacteria bacterium]